MLRAGLRREEGGFRTSIFTALKGRSSTVGVLRPLGVFSRTPRSADLFLAAPLPFDCPFDFAQGFGLAGLKQTEGFGGLKLEGARISVPPREERVGNPGPAAQGRDFRISIFTALKGRSSTKAGSAAGGRMRSLIHRWTSVPLFRLSAQTGLKACPTLQLMAWNCVDFLQQSPIFYLTDRRTNGKVHSSRETRISPRRRGEEPEIGKRKIDL